MSVSNKLTPPLIPYDLWAAGALFINTGYPLDAVLALLKISADAWHEINAKFRALQSAGAWWWQYPDWPDANTDPEFLKYITHGKSKPNAGTYKLGPALAEICKNIRNNHKIGPFAETDWTAIFIGEHYSTNGLIYSHNGREVFFDGLPLWGKDKRPIADINAPSFQLLSNRWMRDSKRVYAQGQQGSKVAWNYFYEVKHADPESFTPLNLGYAKDKNAAYYITDKRIKTLSAAAFSIIPVNGKTDDSKYAKDNEHVYAAGIKIAGANPKKFQQVGDGHSYNGEYFSDGAQVWYHNKLLANADAGSFIIAEAGQYSATDKNRVYWHGLEQNISKEYTEKGWHDFFTIKHPDLADYWWHKENQRLQNISTQEKTLLGGEYYRDSERVYIKHDQNDYIWLQDIDLNSFRYLTASFCESRGQLYSYTSYHKGFLDGGLLKNGDPQTLIALEYGWYADKNNAYKQNWRGYAQAVKIHRASFKPIDKDSAQDDLGLIKGLIRKRPK